MSWKKNVFSYLLWVFYAVAAEVGLVCLADAVCDSVGVEIYIGTIACALYIVAAGAGVFLIHRFAPKYSGEAVKHHSMGRLVEAAVAVILLTIGFVLRLREIGDAGEGIVYYELAAVVSEEEIPQVTHGAVYFYIRMLRGLFYFIGNKLMAAVWAQILIQLGAMLFLYLAARRLAGNVAAAVMLAFGMFSSYLIGEASGLSPAMLYLFLWAAALLLISSAARAKQSLWGFLPVGIVIAFVSYLDVAGCLLLLIAVAVIFCEEKEGPGIGRRCKCLLFCFMGAGAGFTGCMLADSAMSGKKFAEVMDAWFRLYRPQDFRLPVSMDVQGTMAGAIAEAMTGYIILFCVLTLGMYSFWRNRKSDHMKAWILLLIVLVLAGCFGVFTEEMPMGIYMYLLLAMMAGIAVEECVREIRPETAPVPLMPAKADAPKNVETVVQTDGGDAAALPGREAASQPLQEQGEKEGEDRTKQTKPVQFIENPLPLPKKHVKRTLDYGVAVPEGKDDFDLVVDEKDDFDI